MHVTLVGSNAFLKYVVGLIEFTTDSDVFLIGCVAILSRRVALHTLHSKMVQAGCGTLPFTQVHPMSSAHKILPVCLSLVWFDITPSYTAQQARDVSLCCHIQANKSLPACGLSSKDCH